MPARLIITLEPQEQVHHPPRHTGPVVHAALLDALRQMDADLAEAVHESASPALWAATQLLPPGRAARTGEAHRWRIEVGLLDDRLVAPTAEALDGLRRMRVGRHRLSVDRIDVFGETYDDLLHRADSATSWDLVLASPTTIRLPRVGSGPGLVQPFPLPHELFERLRRRWQRAATVPLPHGTEQAVATQFAVSRADVRTHPYRIKSGGTQVVGASGRVTYALVGRTCEAARRGVGALVALASYSGLGDYTTKGMGFVAPPDAFADPRQTG